MYEKALCKDTQIEISCKALQSLTGLSHFKFSRAVISGNTVVTEIEPTLGYAFCPCCRKKSRSVHSHYIRHIRDLPLHGRSLEMTFRARRFRCKNPRCQQSVFMDQPPELVVRYGRRSVQERDVLLKLAVEESAMAASRVATLVGMPVSPSTVLRIVKGNWKDPDRAGGYAKAVSDGIPAAIQIADRFHLVMNCGVNIMKQMRKDIKDIKDEIFSIDGTDFMDVRNETLLQQVPGLYEEYVSGVQIT